MIFRAALVLAIVGALGCAAEQVRIEVPDVAAPAAQVDPVEAALERAKQESAPCRKAADRLATLDERLLGDSVIHYNRGVLLRRCGLPNEARAAFRAALEANSRLHYARAALAVLEVELAAQPDLERAIGELHRAVIDAKYDNAEALLELARMQLMRRSPVRDEEGEDDFARALLNIQRALAIDEHLPAAHAMACAYYLERARAGARGALVMGPSRVDARALRLALRSCENGLRRFPDSAALHHTLGLVELARGQPQAARDSFRAALLYDPEHHEAQRGEAAASLWLRDFTGAARIYARLCERNGDDYDALVGLALALAQRSSIPNEKGRKELARAIQLLPNRPDAYYALGLSWANGPEMPGVSREESWLRAVVELERFVVLAGSEPDLAAHVSDARTRIEVLRQRLGGRR